MINGLANPETVQSPSLRYSCSANTNGIGRRLL